MRFSRRSLIYLALGLGVFGAAILLAATAGIGAGWAFVTLLLLCMVMVGHDAYSRGMTPLWGLLALSVIGMAIYVREVRRRTPPPFA